MSASPQKKDVPVLVLDRVLAFGALALAAASVLCFLAIIGGTAFGMRQEDFGGGAWPLVAAIPLWGLPAAFVMIMALLTITFIRRGRETRS